MSNYWEERRKALGLTDDEPTTTEKKTNDSNSKDTTKSSSDYWSERRKALGLDTDSTESKVDSSYIDSFIKDVQSHLDTKNLTGDLSSAYDSWKKQNKDLRARESAIRQYLTENKDSITEESYNSMMSFLDDFGKASTQFSYSIYDAERKANINPFDKMTSKEVLAAWDKVKADAAAEKEERERAEAEARANETFWDKLGRWLGGGVQDTTLPMGSMPTATTTPTTDYSEIAYTTADGRNVTWEKLYNNKLADEEFERLYSEYSAQDDWKELSKDPTFNAQGMDYKSDYDILWELNMAHNVPLFADAVGDDPVSQQIFKQTEERRKYIEDKYGVDLHDGGGMLTIQELMTKLGAPDKTISYASYMTEKERSLLNYIFNTQGYDAAATLHDTREEIYQDRHIDTSTKNAIAWGKDHPFWASVASIPLSVASGVEFVTDTINQLNTGEKQYNDLAGFSSGLRGGVMEGTDWKIGDFDAFDFVYGTGMSMADSMSSMVLFGSLGGVNLGLSAAGQSYNDAIKRGMSQDQALSTAITAGVAEGLFETVSIGKFKALRESGKSGLKNIALDFAKLAVTNASEETFTEIANVAYDILANGGFSQYETSVRQYMNGGLSEEEARKKASGEIVSQIVEAGASGLLMGFGFGGINAAGKSYSNYKTDTKVGNEMVKSAQAAENYDSISALKSLAYEMAGAKNTLAEKQLAKTAGKINYTDLKARQVGKLHRLLTDSVSSQNAADIQSALVESGINHKVAANLIDTLTDGDATAFMEAVAELDKADAEKVVAIVGNTASAVERDMKLAFAEQGTYISNEEAPAEVLKGDHKVSEEGKTLYVNENGETEEVSISKIVSTEGDIKVALDNGKTVSVKDLELSTDAEAMAFEMVTRMETTPETAQVIFEAVKASNATSATNLFIDVPTAYRYGLINYEAGLAKLRIPNELKKLAYNRGKVDAETSPKGVKKTETKQEGTTPHKEGNVIFDFKFKEDKATEIQKASLAGIKLIAKMSSLEIHIYKSWEENGKRYAIIDGAKRLAPNGVYKVGTNKIYLDINAGADADGTMLYTFGHEVTHYIAEWNWDGFKRLGDFLIKNFAKNKIPVADRIARQKEIRANSYKLDGKALPSETQLYMEAYEEVVAEAMTSMFADPNAYVKLAELKKQDKTLWQKLGEAIKKMLDKFKSLLGAYDTKSPDAIEAEYVSQFKADVYDKLQDLYLKAFVEADANYRAGVDGGKPKQSGRKYSYSSIAHSFFGDNAVTIKDFEDGSYKKTEGYNRYVEQCLDNMRQTSKGKFDSESALKEIKASIDGIVRVAVAMKKAGYDILDDNAKRETRDSKKRLLFSSLEPNSDYFTSSDISTICDKRINFAEIYDEIVRREAELGVPKGKRFFDNVDNYFLLHKIMADKGLTQPCRQCYVESMRKNLAPMANAFLKLMQETDPNNKANDQLFHPKGKNKGESKTNNAKLRESLLEAIEAEQYEITADKLTVKMLTTAEGLATLKMQAPLIYEAFNSFYGQSKPKMPKSATPFRFGELTALLTDHNGKVNERLVKQIVSTGGFRLQSYSDFQIQNFADVLQVIFEAGTLGLNGHAYTKVPAFLEATKGTNLKRNISIFMYNDGGAWKLDRNDSFPYDLDRIYDIVKSDKQGNTSIIAVVQNEDMAAWIMANDNILYFIPFHKSGMKMGTVRETIVKEGGREIKGYKGIKDHTKQQSEVWATTTADHKAYTKVKNGINIYDFWDFDNAGNLSQNDLIEKNVKAYIDACKEAGYLPKFREYVMNNGKVLDSILNYAKQLGFAAQDATIDDISFKYKEFRIPYGYYKCLGDFGMFTPDGKASPIERLSLSDYNFDEAVDFFSSAETLRRNEILQQIANGEERERYRNSNMTTAEIAEAVQAKRQQVVDEVVSGEYKGNLYSEREANEHREKAVEEFGYTTSFNEAGYILPDGKMLNFSGEKDKHFGTRTLEHRAIGRVFDDTKGSEAIYRFMAEGNVRLVSISPGIEIGIDIAPTVSQYNTISRFIAESKKRGYFDVDFTDANGNSIGTLSYKGTIDTSEIIYDIKDYFKTGEVRDQSNQYFYSERDSSYMDAVNRGDMEAAQRMVDEAAKAAGYTSPKLYHGTNAFGFTTVKTTGVEMGVEWSPFFATSNPVVATTYSGAVGTKNIGSKKRPSKSIGALRDEARYRLNDTDDYSSGVISDKADADYFIEKFGDLMDSDTLELMRSGKQGAFATDRQVFTFVPLENGFTLNDYAEQSGNYGLYANTADFLVIDGKGRLWDRINSQYGNKTRTIAENAYKQGYSGVTIKNICDTGMNWNDALDEDADVMSDVYIFFKPQQQVKSADPVTYDDNGDVIPLSKRFNAENSDIRYSERSTNAPTFYSYMGKVVDGIKSEKVGANGVVPYLKGKGVKDEEIKWSGIEAWLEGKKSVTKAELQEFVAGSQLQIEEEMSGYNKEAYAELEALWKQHMGVSLSETFSDDFDLPLTADNMADVFDDAERDGYDVPSIEDQRRMLDLANKAGNEGRWSKYKLPGGSNYRELVFKMPNSSYSNKAMRRHWGYEAEGVLAHARIQDMTTSDGKKMLFVEELQSDWHNEGANKGYKSSDMQAKIDALEAKANELFLKVEDYSTEMTSMAGEWDIIEKTPKGAKLIREYREADKAYKKALDTEINGAEDAPFRSTYHEYVLKRLLRMAAEEGYDSIGWTPADIQSQRWSEDYAEAYRIEYDQEMPKFLRKYGKKWGATVGTTKVSNDIDVWSMDITDSMKDSVLNEGQAMYQERDPDSISTRTLLANALESTAQNDIERNKLAQYKSKLALIESEQAKLAEVRQKAHDLRFKKGRTAEETKKLRELDFEANQIANRINTYDRQLFALEATSALKGVLEREKRAAYKKAEQRGRDALKRHRERASENYKKLLAEKQEARKKSIESRHKTEMRHKIKKVVSDLDHLLRHGSKERNVKLGLQAAVASALEAVNMDTVAADKRIAKLREDLMKAKTPEKIQEISRKIDHIQAQGDRMASRLEELRRAYADIKASDDPELTQYYKQEASIIADKVDSVMKLVGNTPLRNMSLSQLEAVYELYQVVLTTVRGANEAFVNGRVEDLHKNVSDIMTEVSELPAMKEERSAIGETVRSFLWNELIPVYAFDRIGSKTFTRFFWELVRGQNTFANDVEETETFAANTREKYGYSKWDFNKVHEFKLSDGRTFRVTLKHMMSIYAYSKREQALDHMRVGGFFFNDKETFRRKKGVLKVIKSNEEGYYIDDLVLEAIKGEMSKEQLLYVDEMQDYLTKMGEKGNEVSRVLWGIDIFKEKVYFPLKSSKDFVFQANQTAQETSLKNDGMTKETKPGASNPIVLEAFDDVWANHTNRMSQYHSFVLPIENLNKILNYGTWAGTASVSVSTLINSRHGGAAIEYLTNFVKDLNGASTMSGASNPFFGFVGKFKKTAVAASLSVVAQQPSAVLRAMAVMDAKYFVGMPSGEKLTAKWQEMQKYAPIAIIKKIGGFDAGAGRQVSEWVNATARTGIDKVMGKIDDITMAGAAWGDMVGWCAIWEAVKRELKATTDLEEGSEEFLQKAGERITEIIVRTQVYDSTLSRSGYMRSKHESVRMMTSFMGEPTVSINMMLDAVTQAKRKTITKKHAARVIGSVYTSVLAAAIAASLIYALRDDDDDEAYLEKFAEALGGKLKDEINPLNMLPVIRDIASILDGWDVERTDVAIFKDLKDAFDGLQSDNKGVWKKIEDFAGAFGNAFGVPVKNLLRTGREMYNLFENIFDGVNPTGMGDAFVEGFTGKETEKTKSLYDAIVNGDEARLEVLKNSYKDDSAYESAIRKALRENDPRIKEAAQADFDGDVAEYDRIIKEIIGEGYFNKADVLAAVKAERNRLEPDDEETETPKADKDVSIYNVEHYFTAIRSGKTSLANTAKDDIIKTAVANGKSRAEAESSFYSSFRNIAKEAYADGELTRSEAEKMLVNYGDLDADDAYWKLKEWDYYKQNGDTDGYSKYTGFYEAVQTGRNLKAVISEYTSHGVEAKTLASQITSYFKPLYKEMSNAERASLKGYLLNAYVQLGYNRADKSKDIDKWLKD